MSLNKIDKETNKRPLRLLIILIAVVIALIILFFFLQSPSQMKDRSIDSSSKSAPIDCTPKENEIYDSECMFGAMDSCTPAKAEVSGMGITRYTEVKGKIGNNCGIYVSVEYSDGDLYEATCLVPLSLNISKIMSPFRAESVGEYVTGIEKYCSGDWVDLVKSRAEAQGNTSKPDTDSDGSDDIKEVL